MRTDKKFSTRFGVIAATVGSAVGLGNIWRFPYECGSNGGAAFLLAYIAFVVILGIPVICSEFVIGKAAGCNVGGALKQLKASPFWHIIGYLGILTSFLIMGFYSVVAGWCIDYIWQSAVGFGNAVTESEMHLQFDSFTSNWWRPLVWTFGFLFINFLVISRGVEKGIERMSNLLMPLLFVILVAFCINSFFLPGSERGYEFFLKPDFSKIDTGVLLSAMGQAFFSLSVGMGVLITYASYFKKSTNLARTASITAVLDTFVAVMAGLIIFPACYAFGEEPAAGPKLVFEVLPSIFMSMPAGRLWGVLFFVLLFVASLTSTVSLTEVVIAWLEGEHKIKRGKATMLYAVSLSGLVILSSLSFGVLSDWHIFGKNFFDLLDFLSSNIMLPFGGMLISVYVGWFMERRLLYRQFATGAGENAPSGAGDRGESLAAMKRNAPLYVKLIIFSLKFIAPLSILAIFVAGLL